MSRRRRAISFVLALVLFAGCADGYSGPGPYPTSNATPVTATATFTDTKDVVYRIDASAACVQADLGGGMVSPCVAFRATFSQQLWRSGGRVGALVVQQISRDVVHAGDRVVAQWSTPAHDPEPDQVDAVEVAPGVYAFAYESPISDPIWGVQLRGADGRSLGSVPLVGQFLNAPR